jgi:hypothetical protein
VHGAHHRGGVGDVLEVDAGDPGPALRFGLDEAVGGEPGDGLPDGRPGQAEAVGDEDVDFTFGVDRVPDGIAPLIDRPPPIRGTAGGAAAG